MTKTVGKLLTIGQFARLHQINKKTLMWYDEIDLFKPAAVGENGYRYYTYQQCSALETILMLRELNVSIPEIQTFMKHRTADSFHSVLSEKASEIDHAIQHLTQIKDALIYRKAELEQLKTICFSEYYIENKPEQKLIFLKTAKEIPLEQEAEMIYSETRRHSSCRMYGILYGSLLPVSSLYRHDFTDYQGIFLKVPEADMRSNIHIQPAGTYLCTYAKGSWDKLPLKYLDILEYASQRHIQLEGYAYETGVNDVLAASMNDYITKIEIPIKQTE